MGEVVTKEPKLCADHTGSKKNWIYIKQTRSQLEKDSVCIPLRDGQATSRDLHLHLRRMRMAAVWSFALFHCPDQRCRTVAVFGHEYVLSREAWRLVGRPRHCERPKVLRL
jgi:hypothetical protein